MGILEKFTKLFSKNCDDVVFPITSTLTYSQRKNIDQIGRIKSCREKIIERSPHEISRHLDAFDKTVRYNKPH